MAMSTPHEPQNTRLLSSGLVALVAIGVARIEPIEVRLVAAPTAPGITLAQRLVGLVVLDGIGVLGPLLGRRVRHVARPPDHAAVQVVDG